jgi:hypothetical protein
MARQQAGADAAKQVTRELNELLGYASDETVEQHIVDARGRIIEQTPGDLREALSDAESVLGDACHATQSDDLEYELRQLRQAIVGLVEGEGEGVA